MFTNGFEKLALDWSRVAKSGMKALKSPAVIRGAAAGAGTGAIAGAVSDKDSRIGGAVKGALLGGAIGGGAAAGMRARTAANKLKGVSSAGVRADKAHGFKFGGGGNGN